MAIELCKVFIPLDQAALAKLGPEDLAVQHEARLKMLEYVDAFWDPVGWIG
ncbi:hypothetical protein [Kribbella sp. DT2]|uniref:hypothetical protein n=1 Tax=Kribbella sp. DT2 TaxID=3393427 RepID=UPI003CF0AC1F